MTRIGSRTITISMMLMLFMLPLVMPAAVSADQPLDVQRDEHARESDKAARLEEQQSRELEALKSNLWKTQKMRSLEKPYKGDVSDYDERVEELQDAIRQQDDE